MTRKELKMLVITVTISFFLGAMTSAWLVFSPRVYGQVARLAIPVPPNLQEGKVYHQLQARNFKVINGSGKLIASLSTSSDGLPVLSLFNPVTGKESFKASLEYTQGMNIPYISLFDNDGRERVYLSLQTSLAEQEPMLIFRNRNGKDRFRLETNPRALGKLYYAFDDVSYALQCNPNYCELVFWGKNNYKKIIQ